MNSTAKGNDLEAKIYRLFAQEISEDRFFAKKECCKLFSKKGYYSKDRDGEIIFDVSVEIFLPGQDRYSLLVLVECKNYGHAVPVDDAEEFLAKAQQISGVNIKGMLASTNSFAEGTRKFAQSKGMGLLRYYDELDFKWVLTRSPSSIVTNRYALSEWMNALRGICDESHRSRYFDCYFYVAGNYTNSLGLFLSSLVRTGVEGESDELLSVIENPAVESRPVVPYREDAEIERLTESALASVHYARGEVNLEELCRWQSLEQGLEVVIEESTEPHQANRQILGKATFLPPKITVFRAAHRNAAQQKFTLAHELGHVLLGHGKYMAAEYCQETDFELESPPQLGIKDVMRMEWQANCFASCLTLPRGPLIDDFLRLRAERGIRDRGFGLLYLDEQMCNLNDYYHVTNGLRAKYQVSRQVITIRLKELGLLNDARGRKPNE